MSNVKVYVWPDENGWDSSATDRIINAFKPLKAKKNGKAAIGAGASGLLPELNILIEFINTPLVQLLIAGFVGAIGGEAWELTKKGLKKALKIKPKPQDLSQYGYKGIVTEADLIFWIHFEDIQILISMVISEEEEMERAIELLPQAVDDALKSEKQFGRIYWMDGKWTAL